MVAGVAAAAVDVPVVVDASVVEVVAAAVAVADRAAIPLRHPLRHQHRHLCRLLQNLLHLRRLHRPRPRLRCSGSWMGDAAGVGVADGVGAAGTSMRRS